MAVVVSGDLFGRMEFDLGSNVPREECKKLCATIRLMTQVQSAEPSPYSNRIIVQCDAAKLKGNDRAAALVRLYEQIDEIVEHKRDMLRKQKTQIKAEALVT